MKTPRRGARNWLVIMVKEPVTGQVKTRLGADIGQAAATRFYRHTTIALATRLGFDPRWRTVLAVSPDAAIMSRVWPRHTHRIPQGRGDLGARMQRIPVGLPPGPVVIIGSDCPLVTRAHICQAFGALGDNDCVVGPASDGGYWLIGVRRPQRVRGIFDKVRWSTRFTYEDTLRNLHGLKVASIDVLYDVDTGKEYAALGNRVGRRILSPYGGIDL